MSKILIAGGSGLIGSRLIQMFKQTTIEFVLLSTQKSKCNTSDTYYWNPQTGEIPQIDLSQISACVNFSGQGIFDQRIDIKRLSVLYDSRIQALQTLSKMFEVQGLKIPHLISASAIGLYPDTDAKSMNESNRKANNWVADLVQAWEEAAHNTAHEHLNVMRIGIVLSPKGGFLDRLTPLTRLWLGAIPGNGRQYCSWIHIDDVCGIVLHLLNKPHNATYNVCAPQPCTLADLQNTLAECLQRKNLLPNIPEFMLKLLFGQRRAQLIIANQNIDSKAITDSGYAFKFKHIKDCLQNIYPA